MQAPICRRARLACGVLVAALYGGLVMADTSALRNEVAAVFDAVRAGDSSRVGQLVAHGDSLIPAVTSLLQDPNAAVRREAIALLDALDSKAAALAAVRSLGDADTDISRRAARLVFRSVMRHGPKDFPGLGDALMTRPEQLQQDAAKLLLLGFTNQGEDALRKALANGPLVKLSDDGPAVRAALPAEMSLSRRGAANARARLLERIAAGETADLEFLLRNIGVIDAPRVLHALAGQTLGDERPVGGGVPAGAEPSRRMTDLAVEAFIERLGLNTGIEITPEKRYSPAQIESVRRAVSAGLPQ
jgi:hypothetical protein